MDATKFELALKTEPTPGTATSLASADVVVRLLADTSPDFDPEINDPEEAQGDQSPNPISVGRVLGSISARYRLRGPGDLTTEPAIAPLFRTARFFPNAVEVLSIGAVTSGPFQCSERITGGTSSAIGLVIRQTASGAASVPYIPISGTFQNSETITGSQSSATATTSSTPTATGYAFRPDDTDVLTTGTVASARFNNDGLAYDLRSVVSDLSILFKACTYAEVTQNIQGPMDGDPTDTAMFNPTYPEETGANRGVPKMSNDAGLVIGSHSPTDIDEITFNYPSTASERTDVNGGYSQCIRTMNSRRDVPTIAIPPAQVPVATFAAFASLTAETLSYLEFTHGTGTGKTWRLCCPTAQVIEFGWSQRDALALNPLVFRLNRGHEGNDECFLWVS